MHHLGVGAAHKGQAVTILIDADTVTVIHPDIARLRPTALPIAANMAIGSPLAETVGSARRTAHSSAASHPRTIPSARSADMSSSASHAIPSRLSRSSATLRPSPADTGVRLPHQVGHCDPKIINSVRGRHRCESSQAKAPPTQQAGRFVTDRRRAVDVGAVGNQVPGLVGGQVYAQREELRRRPSPCAIRGSPSKSRCLSKETHDAGKGFCRVDIHRVLVQSNLPCDIKSETTTGGTTRTNLWKTAYLRYPKGRHAVPANGPTAIAGMRRLPDSACHSSIASVSIGLMTAVEPQQRACAARRSASGTKASRSPSAVSTATAKASRRRSRSARSLRSTAWAFNADRRAACLTDC
jgi:hypothetical protein